MSLHNMLPQLQPYKDRIPQFILKLYYILQKKNHSQYLTWFNDQQIVIKNAKKFQQKVLSQYFRHKHLSSFIRQLNMYKFSKVSKIIKEKNHMYFRNENFQRGNIENLLKIKRNIKKNRGTQQTITVTPTKEEDLSDQDNISINEKLQKTEKQTRELNQYKQFVKKSISQIKDIIMSKVTSTPSLEQQFKPILYICDQLLQTKKNEVPSFALSSSNQLCENLNLLNASHQQLSNFILPSQCSLSNFNSFHNSS